MFKSYGISNLGLLVQLMQQPRRSHTHALFLNKQASPSDVSHVTRCAIAIETPPALLWVGQGPARAQCSLTEGKGFLRGQKLETLSQLNKTQLNIQLTSILKQF